MKKITLLSLILFCATVTLPALWLGYRTEAASDFIPEWLLPTLAGSIILIAALLLLMTLQLNRRCQAWRRLEANLEDWADMPDSETVPPLEMAAVGHDIPPVVLGWNKLVSYMEKLQEGAAWQQDEGAMGQFLCSYDSQRLLGVLDSLTEGVLLADADGAVVLVNRACEGLLGRPLNEIIGCPIIDIFNEDDSREKIERLLDAQGTVSESRFEIVLGQEPQRTILSATGLRLGYSGESCDILISLRDVTQQKLAQSGRDNFIAHVSHELRSPLTNIRAYAETLLSDMILDANTQKEAFNVINEETSRLIRLVNDVLDISRMETGSIVLERGNVVTDRLIRQCVNDIKAAAAEKSIALQTNYHPKLPDLYADREKLAIVVNNLLTNAIKYTPEDGTVFIETNVDEAFVYIKVTDTGYGIAEDDLEKIFEKFYRVEREETLTITGSGLGLAISKEIVMLHGGMIEAVSELNNGTEMTVKLPITLTGPALGPASEPTVMSGQS